MLTHWFVAQAYAVLVTDEGAGTHGNYRWTYTFTNNGVGPDDDYSFVGTAGYQSFSVGGPNVDGYSAYNLVTATDWRDNPYHYSVGQQGIYWTTPDEVARPEIVEHGETVSFSFDTPPRPLVDANATFTTYAAGSYTATGTVKAPGIRPTVTVSVARNAIEYEATASPAAPLPGLIRVARTGDTGTASKGDDYLAIGSTVTIPAGAAHVDVPVTPVDDGIREWQGPESVIVSVTPSPVYFVSRTGSATLHVGEQGTPTFTPVVDDTITGADDYSLVGKAVNVGYLIDGDHVLRHGTVTFTATAGTGSWHITGLTEVSLSTDSTGKAYVFTQATPLAAETFLIAAQVKAPTAPVKNNPPAKTLPRSRLRGSVYSFFPKVRQKVLKVSS